MNQRTDCSRYRSFAQLKEIHFSHKASNIGFMLSSRSVPADKGRLELVYKSRDMKDVGRKEIPSILSSVSMNSLLVCGEFVPPSSSAKSLFQTYFNKNDQQLLYVANNLFLVLDT